MTIPPPLPGYSNGHLTSPATVTPNERAEIDHRMQGVLTMLAEELHALNPGFGVSGRGETSIDELQRQIQQVLGENARLPPPAYQ